MLHDIVMKQGYLLTLAWAALAAIAFVTLSPIGIRPRIPMPVDLERALAFCVTGLLFALAYPRHIGWAAAIVLLGVFGLELLQELRPDRHAQFADAVVKAAGASLGLILGWLFGNVRGTARQRMPRQADVNHDPAGP